MITFAGFAPEDREYFILLFNELGRRGTAYNKLDAAFPLAPKTEGPAPDALPHLTLVAPQLAFGYSNLLSDLSDTASAAVESRLLELAPQIVVWLPGTVVGHLAHAAACRHSISSVALLSPFLEFKLAQPLSIVKHGVNERFIAAGSLGAQRLVDAGVSPSRIDLVGSPYLDRYLQIAPQSCSTRILLPLQDAVLPAGLMAFIMGYLVHAPNISVRVRPHPCVKLNSATLDVLNRHPQIEVSQGTLLEDLTNCAICIGESSLVLIESILCGAPAIVWDTAPYPLELFDPNFELLFRASSAATATRICDMLLSSFSSLDRQQLRTRALERFVAARGNSTSRIISILEKMSAL